MAALTGILEFFQSIWDMVTNIISMLLNAVGVAISAMQSTTEIIMFFPPILSTSMAFILFIVVLNYLIGRSNQ